MGAHIQGNRALDLVKRSCFSQDAAVSELGMAMLDILAQRHSQREFSSTPLPLYQLSRLLWAAAGYNRPDHRTAPSAYNQQEVDVYVVLEHGLYCYDATLDLLLHVCSDDLRHLAGTQEFVATAPLNLVYIADLTRMQLVPAEERQALAAIGAGCMSQNVALLCAAEGLGCVTRTLIDRERLAAAIGLRPGQRIVLAQSVGAAPR